MITLLPAPPLLSPLVRNSPGFARVPARPAGTLHRDAGLRIRLDRASRQFLLLPYGDLFPPPATWDAVLPLTPNDVYNAAQTCYTAWQKALVDLTMPVLTKDGTTENRCPFQDAWDHAAQPDLQRKAGAAMALAGAKLFFQLFEQPAHSDQKLHRVVTTLRQASQSGPLTLTVTANKFFAPWPMLYVHPVAGGNLAPDGANFEWEGFWGYRHIVEHNPEYLDVDTRLQRGTGGRLAFSANVNTGIDNQFSVTCVQSHLNFFQGHTSLALVLRTLRSQLQADLMNAGFADQVLYFCCHGITSIFAGGQVNLGEAELALTDGEAITVSDLDFWLGGRNFAPQPLVFINACQGGQFTTRFYQGLAAAFLQHGAVGVIAPLIDMPVVFATEFAVRFFTRLLQPPAPAGQVQRVGPLLRDLTREFVQKHNNPLGLVFALYRGADCFIQ